MLKANKRTVWFLTLLSLVAVISITYLKKESPMPLDGMAIFGDGKTEVTELKETSGETDQAKAVFADSVRFEEMRMEVRNERSQRKDMLTAKLYSNELTAEEKSAAFDEMDELIKQEANESLMEIQIVGLGYPDAFVRKDNGKITVTVLAGDEGHSYKTADEIAKYIMTNFEDARSVQVEFSE